MIMEKKKHTAPIGNGKLLVFEADLGNEHEQEMARRFNIVAATKPQSIQEFFILLAAMYKSEQVPDIDGA
jgi:hypothetical protein